jgi:hypothetical protein
MPIFSRNWRPNSVSLFGFGARSRRSFSPVDLRILPVAVDRLVDAPGGERPFDERRRRLRAQLHQRRHQKPVQFRRLHRVLRQHPVSRSMQTARIAG